MRFNWFYVIVYLCWLLRSRSARLFLSHFLAKIDLHWDFIFIYRYIVPILSFIYLGIYYSLYFKFWRFFWRMIIFLIFFNIFFNHLLSIISSFKYIRITFHYLFHYCAIIIFIFKNCNQIINFFYFITCSFFYFSYFKLIN